MSYHNECPDRENGDCSFDLDVETAPLFDNQNDLKCSKKRLLSAFCIKAVAIVAALFPSFFHGIIRSKLPPEAAVYLQENEDTTIHRRHSDTAYLDGMRGVAALCVFLEHFLVPFWDNIYYAYGGHEDATLIQLPVIRLLYSGSAMVCVFFVISGFILSVKPLLLIQNGDWGLFQRTVESMILRRGIRLFVPSLVVSFTMMIAVHLGLCDIQSAVKYQGPDQVYGEFWMVQPQRVPELLSQISEWASFFIAKVLLPYTWRGTTTGNDYGDTEYIEYGSQLWSVGVEFWASMLLFLTLAGTARIKNVFKIPVFVIFAGFSFWVSRWDVALFLCGSLLAFLSIHSLKSRHIFHTSLFALIFGLGLHAASFPELGGTETPAFAWLCVLTSHSRFWQSIGAIMIITAAENINFIQRLFSRRLFLYVGRISYALYLVHIPLLSTMGWRMVPMIWNFTGHQSSLESSTGIFFAFVFIMMLAIWVSDLYCRFVDEPCIIFARQLEAYIQVPDS